MREGLHFCSLTQAADADGSLLQRFSFFQGSWGLDSRHAGPRMDRWLRPVTPLEGEALARRLAENSTRGTSCVCRGERQLNLRDHLPPNSFHICLCAMLFLSRLLPLSCNPRAKPRLPVISSGLVPRCQTRASGRASAAQEHGGRFCVVFPPWICGHGGDSLFWRRLPRVGSGTKICCKGGSQA